MALRVSGGKASFRCCRDIASWRLSHAGTLFPLPPAAAPAAMPFSSAFLCCSSAFISLLQVANNILEMPRTDASSFWVHRCFPRMTRFVSSFRKPRSDFVRDPWPMEIEFGLNLKIYISNRIYIQS